MSNGLSYILFKELTDYVQHMAMVLQNGYDITADFNIGQCRKGSGNVIEFLKLLEDITMPHGKLTVVVEGATDIKDSGMHGEHFPFPLFGIPYYSWGNNACIYKV